MDLPQNFQIRRREWKLRRLGRRRASFDFVYPVQELAYRFLITGRGLGGELHRGSHQLRYLSRLAIYGCRYVCVGSVHNDSAEVF